MNNTRFTTAVHVLTLLAYEGDDAVTSEYIAGSVNTNAVVIRRILADFREAGLVSSRRGPGGGWLLERPADAITLADVYRIVEAQPLFPLHTNPPNPACPVGLHIQSVLEARFDRARQALLAELDRTTVADLLADIPD